MAEPFVKVKVPDPRSGVVPLGEVSEDDVVKAKVTLLNEASLLTMTSPLESRAVNVASIWSPGETVVPGRVNLKWSRGPNEPALVVPRAAVPAVSSGLGFPFREQTTKA